MDRITGNITLADGNDVKLHHDPQPEGGDEVYGIESGDAWIWLSRADLENIVKVFRVLEAGAI